MFSELQPDLIKAIDNEDAAKIIEYIDYIHLSLDVYKISALHYAARQGKLKSIKCILDKKHHLLDLTDRVGQTPLLLAAANGHIDVVKFLLQKKADVHLNSDDGKTPLHCASEKGYTDIVILLLNNGSNPEALNKEMAFLPIHFAALQGHLDVVKVFLEKFPELLNYPDNFDQTPLIWAAANGHIEIVNFLLQLKAKTDIYTVSLNHDNGKTPLHWASEKGHHDIVTSLLNNGSNPEAITKEMAFLPIHLAAQEGHLDVIKVFLEKFPELLNHPDNFGQTPLIWTAANGHTEIVNFLLQLKAKTDIYTISLNHDSNGKTPLHWASENGHHDIVTSLLNNGSNPEALTKETAFLPIHLAAQEGHLEVVKVFLEKFPALLNYPDKLGQTPLLWSVAEGKIEIVKYLLANGANLNLGTTSNNKANCLMPIYWAAEKIHKTKSLQVKNHYKIIFNLLIKEAFKKNNKISIYNFITDSEKIISVIKDFPDLATFFLQDAFFYQKLYTSIATIPFSLKILIKTLPIELLQQNQIVIQELIVRPKMKFYERFFSWLFNSYKEKIYQRYLNEFIDSLIDNNDSSFLLAAGNMSLLFNLAIPQNVVKAIFCFEKIDQTLPKNYEEAQFQLAQLKAETDENLTHYKNIVISQAENKQNSSLYQAAKTMINKKYPDFFPPATSPRVEQGYNNSSSAFLDCG